MTPTQIKKARGKCPLKPKKMKRDEAIRILMDSDGCTRNQADDMICKDCYK